MATVIAMLFQKLQQGGGCFLRLLLQDPMTRILDAKSIQFFAGRDIRQAQAIPITKPIGPVRKTP